MSDHEPRRRDLVANARDAMPFTPGDLVPKVRHLIDTRQE